MSSFGLEILLLAAVAGFVLYRLYTVLGQRTGHEQRPEPRAEKTKDASVPAEDNVVRLPQAEAAAAPAPAAPVPNLPGVAELMDADPSFHPDQFISGARGAYEMIIEAYAAADLSTLKNLLSDDVYSAFKSAIEARAASNHTMNLTFVGLESADIESAEIENGVAKVTVDFASNQIRHTTAGDGSVVDGDANRIDLVKDRWTFERLIASEDPNWRLSETKIAA